MFLLWLSCSSWGNGGRTGGSSSTSCRDHRNVMNTVELLWKSQFICARHSHINEFCSVQILLFCFYSLTTSLTRWILSITKIKCCKAKKHQVASKMTWMDNNSLLVHKQSANVRGHWQMNNGQVSYHWKTLCGRARGSRMRSCGLKHWGRDRKGHSVDSAHCQVIVRFHVQYQGYNRKLLYTLVAPSGSQEQLIL